MQSKRACTDSLNNLAEFAVLLAGFTVLAFSYFSKHGQRVGLHIQLIWHPKKNLEADLKLKEVKD